MQTRRGARMKMPQVPTFHNLSFLSLVYQMLKRQMKPRAESPLPQWNEEAPFIRDGLASSVAGRYNRMQRKVFPSTDKRKRGGIKMHPHFPLSSLWSKDNVNGKRELWHLHPMEHSRKILCQPALLANLGHSYISVAALGNQVKGSLKFRFLNALILMWWTHSYLEVWPRNSPD